MNKKENSEFGTRIKQARTVAGLYQAELASKAGITKRQISLYESGHAHPREGTLEKLAKALNVTSQWLLTGQGNGIKSLGFTNQMLVKQVPLIDWEDVEYIALGEPLPSYKKLIPASIDVSDKAFALEVMGDSMESSNGGVSFPSGSIVIFDPEVFCMPNESFVLAAFQHFYDDPMFKKYVKDFKDRYLVPLNSQYKAIKCEHDLEIIAKAVQVLIVL